MKFILIVYIALIIPLQGQKTIEKKIDSLIDKSVDQFVEIKFKESLETTNKALGLAEENKYSKGIATANIYIARLLLEMGIYNRSLVYLKEAEEQTYMKEDFFLQAELFRIRGRIYENLKMGSLSMKEFRKQLSVSAKIKSENRKNISKFWAHQNIVQVFERLQESDSVTFHMGKMEELLEQFKTKDELYLFTSTYIKMAELALIQNDFTKAENYLDKSIQLLEYYNSNLKYDVLKVYGDLADARGHVKTAAKYYDDALQNALELEALDHAKYLAKILADYYHSNRLDPTTTNKYLLQYQDLNDSLSVKNQEATELLVRQILDKEVKQSTKKQTYLLYVIICLTSVLLFICFWFFQRNKRTKIRLKKNREIILEKQSLTDELVSQIDVNSFDELIKLAKSNNPAFLTLFKGRYPNLLVKLKELDPKIRSSELIFCAMAYLNFSTKDIAEYTYVTIRAVQVRKNRLRKKYGIASEVDFNSWMRKLGDN